MENLIKKIEERLAEGEELVVREVYKNNMKLTGVSIKNNNTTSEGTVVSAVVYPELMVKSNSKSLDELADEAVEILRKDADIKIYPTIEKDRIYARLINTEANVENIKRLVHRDFLDLTVVYYAVMTEDGSGTALITHELAARYGFTESDLYDAAMANGEYIPKALPMFDDEIYGPSMFYVTNRQTVFGASAILSAECMENVAAIQEGDFFILPSSVHEIIVLPAEEDMDPEQLAVMVNEVNNNCVERQDILSYSVYRYNAETKKVEIAVKRAFEEGGC